MTLLAWLQEPVCLGSSRRGVSLSNSARRRSRRSINLKPVRQPRSPLSAMLIVLLLHMTSSAPPPSPISRALIITTTCANNFDIRLVGGISTTHQNSGYETQLRLGSDTTFLTQGQTKRLNSVTISTHLTYLSENAVLLAFKLENDGPEEAFVDVGVQSDVLFDGNDNSPIDRLPEDRGFVMYSSRNAFTVVVNSYPLVANVSGFWFGLHGSESFWTMANAPDHYEGGDSALEFSWQNITVPPERPVTVSAILCAGLFDAEAPVLVLDATLVPQEVTPVDVLKIGGFVNDSHADALIQLILVINDDYSQLNAIHSELTPGAWFDFDLALAPYALGLGSYDLSFYAVDSYGCVSKGESYTTKVSFSSIFFSYATADQNANFEILLLRGNEAITTSNNTGYYTRMRLEGRMSAEARQGEVVKFLGVTLSTHLTSISDKAVLVAFKLKNGNPGDAYADVEVDAHLAEKEVKGESGDRGFSVGGSPGFLFIGRSYPLVTNVTSYWYGPSNALSGHYWTDGVTDEQEQSDTSVAFSWQHILVPGNGTTILSAIMRYGPPSDGSVELDLNETDIPSHVGISHPLKLYGSVDDSNDSALLDVLMVLNDDQTRLYRIASGLQVNGKLRFQLSLPAYSIGFGEHKLSFYAVDNLGYVSPGHDFTVTVGPDPTVSDSPNPSVSETPTPSNSQSPTPTDSLSNSPDQSPSHSPEHSPTPTDSLPQSPSESPQPSVSNSPPFSPAPTPSLTEAQSPDASPPASPLPDPSGSASKVATPPLTSPLETRTVSESYRCSDSPTLSESPSITPVPPRLSYTYDTQNYFDISAIVGDVEFSTTYGGWGYRTALQVDGDQVQFGSAGHAFGSSGLSITPHLAIIGDQAVLIVFKCTNTDLTAHQVRIAVDASIKIGADATLSATNLDGGQGCQIASSQYAITLIGRSHPLVHDVSSYWFGPDAYRESNRWYSTSSNSYSGNVGIAFSWQGISVPGDSSFTVSAIVRYGSLDSIAPIWSTLDGDIPAQLLDLSAIRIWGTVSDAHPSVWIDLLLVINNDVSRIMNIGEGLSPGVPFDVSYTLDLSWVPLGSCQLHFYAADSVGCISSGQGFTRVKIGFSRTPRPTHSMSPFPSPAQTPWPPAIQYAATTSSNFNIRAWINNNYWIQTTYGDGGYSTRMRVDRGNTLWAASYMQPVTANGVDLTTHLWIIGGQSVLIVFKLTNVDLISHSVDVEVDADLYIENSDGPAISELESGRGLTMRGSSHAFTLIGRSYPLVHDVSTIWSGPLNNLDSNYWSDISSNSYGDAGLAFSWQNLDLPVDGSVTVSAILRYGSYDAGAPSLTISGNSIPAQLWGDEWIDLTGAVSDSHSLVWIDLLLVVNDDLSEIHTIFEGLQPGDPFSIRFWHDFSTVSIGPCQLTFYAVNSVGCISSGQSFQSTKIGVSRTPRPSRSRSASISHTPTPTHSPTPSPSASRSRSPSRSRTATRSQTPTPTRSRSRSPSRTSTPTPSRTVSRSPSPTASPIPPRMDYSFGSSAYFNAVAYVAGSYVSTTYSDRGYQMNMRVDGGTLQSATNGSAIWQSGITMTQHLTVLGQRTLLIVFKFTNGDLFDHTVDVEVDADVQVGSDDSPFIVDRSNGFSMSDSSTTITFIGRSYPLVRDVSSYWFGRYDARSSNYWNNVAIGSYNGDGGIAYSWQQVYVPAEGFAVVSAIMRVGQYDSAAPTLEITGVDIPSRLYDWDQLGISGTVDDSYASVSIDLILVVNGDYSNIRTIFRWLVPGQGFNFYFTIDTTEVPLGTCELAFYAVDSLGLISTAKLYETTKIRATRTPGPSATRSVTPFPSASPRETPSPTASRTRSRTPTRTRTPTPSPSRSQSPSPTASRTRSKTPSVTRSPSRSRSPSRTPSPTASASRSHTPTRTRSPPPTPTVSKSPSPTASATRSKTPTRTRSARPTISQSRTPTATRSPAATRTRSRSRSPLRTANSVPHFALDYHYLSGPGAAGNFELYGFVGEYPVSTTQDRGYRTRMRVDNTFSSNVVGGQSVSVADVILTTHLVSIARDAVLITFKISNGDTTRHYVDLEVDAEMKVDGNSEGLVWDLDGYGLTVVADGWKFSFIGRSYPLVTDVSAYWFGYAGDRTQNYWNSAGYGDAYSGNVGIVFSWQQLDIPPGSWRTVSLIVKSGDFNRGRASLYMSNTQIPAEVLNTESFIVEGTAYSSESDLSLDLLLMVNGDSSLIFRLFWPLSSGESFSEFIALEAYGVREGYCQLNFYAIDTYGCVSSSWYFTTSVVVPRIAFTHDLGQYRETNFDIFARAGSRPIIHSTYGRGYSTRIRIGGDSVTVGKGKPATLLEVTLTSHLRVIGDQALLIVFKLTNAAVDTRIVDVGVDANIFISNEDPVVRDLGNGRGFSITDGTDTFTFIARSSPLVRDVSTYWFGYSLERVGNFWRDTSTPYFTGGDTGLAFSWQQVVVEPDNSLTLSIIVRYGDLDDASPVLDLAATSIGARIGIHQSVPLHGVVYGSRSSASIEVVLIVNNDYSNLYRISWELSSGSSFDISFAVVEYSIGLGPYNLSFFAFDSFGCISEGVLFQTTVVELPPTESEPVDRLDSASSAGEIAGASIGAIVIIVGFLIGAVVLVKFVQSRVSTKAGESLNDLASGEVDLDT